MAASRTPGPDLDDAINDMTTWLTMMLRPVEDGGEIDSEVYRHLDDDTLELGDRVADDLLSEWAWGREDATGLTVVLEQRIRHAADRAGRPSRSLPVAEPAPELSADPGVTVWSVPAYAPYVIPMSLLRAITTWMAENHVQNASGGREVSVRSHADGTRAITYQQGRPASRYETPDPAVTEIRVPLITEPPALPDLTGLGPVLEEHPVGAAHFNMPLPIGSQVCCTCTRTSGHPVLYPCPPVVTVATSLGVEVYPDDDAPNYEEDPDD